MVDFNDRRKQPVSDVLPNLYEDGKRYRVNQPDGAYVDGYLTPGEDGSVNVTKSTKSKSSATVDPRSILSIESARSGKKGRSNVYSRPNHVQDGYGRV